MNNNLVSYIEKFEEICKNPKKMIEDHKAKTGKGAVGVLPLYAPEEIIDAAGYLPVGIWGGTKEISEARGVFPAFACSIAQSIMEYKACGVYDNLETVLISVPCDTLKCLSQKWKGNEIVFTHPQNRKIEAANFFLVEEYKIIRKKLEKILNLTITDEAIKASIKVYNENRRVMREFCEVANTYPNIVTPTVRHHVIKARWFMTKAEHTKLVKEFIELLKAEPVVEWKGKKIVLTGILAEPVELLKIFEEEGLAVVADDLAQETRQFRNDVPEGDADPLYSLAKWWQELDGCSIATDPKKVRGQMLIDLVKKYNADGVVVCMLKFCDPEEFDYPVYYKEFTEAGINNTIIEVDLSTAAFGQTKTKIQTFKEIL